MPDDTTAYEPSDAQLAVLDAFRDRDYCCSVGEACEAAGVHRVTWYRWHERQEGFSAWWAAQAERHFARLLPRVYGASARSALGEDVLGSHADRKLLLERFDRGFVPRTRQDQRVELTAGADEESMDRMARWLDLDDPPMLEGEADADDGPKCRVDATNENDSHLEIEAEGPKQQQ